MAQNRQGLQFMHTPSVEVYEGPIKTRNLAPSQSCHMPFCVEGICECSDEPAPWHRGPSLYAYTRCKSVCKSDQNKKLSLSHSCGCMIVVRLSVKTQASLRIGTESPGPTVYAYTNTRASNLGYLAPPGQFFMGAKLFIGTPWMGNEGVLKKNWFGLCEIAWFLCQPKANLRRGVCL